MHLYEKKKLKQKDAIFVIVIYAVLILALVLVMSGTGFQAEERGEELTRQAVTRAAVTCYTIEGRYPESMDYMMEHYGLAVNTDKYFVDYSVYGENVMPKITVITRK